jgi:hypothetical protein
MKQKINLVVGVAVLVGAIVVVGLALVVVGVLEFNATSRSASKPSDNRVVLTPVVIGTFKMGVSTCTSYGLKNKNGLTITRFIVCDPPLAGACVQGSVPGKAGTP